MLKIESLTKSFDELEVIKDFSLTVNDGEVVVIIGPSGTGKSTLLRCVNYLAVPTSGTIEIDDLSVSPETASKKDILRLRKLTSMVFQNYNLFANKTALENIMEPLLVAQKWTKTDAHKRAMDILKLISLEDKADSYPAQLSGGQQQRIGIGRAMSTSPQIILFDEPTSSLDPELVGEVLDVIKKLTEENITMLITTHEMEFARGIADRIVFIDDGVIVEEGTPEEIFENAKNERTREFLGKMYESKNS